MGTHPFIKIGIASASATGRLERGGRGGGGVGAGRGGGGRQAKRGGGDSLRTLRRGLCVQTEQ